MILKFKIDSNAFKNVCKKMMEAYNLDEADKILKEEFPEGMSESDIQFLILANYRYRKLDESNDDKKDIKKQCYEEAFNKLKDKWGLDYKSIDEMPDLSEMFLGIKAYFDKKAELEKIEISLYKSLNMCYTGQECSDMDCPNCGQ